jgi:hypothetical protein
MIDGIDVKGNFSDTAPIAIGHHSMLGSDCNLVMGPRVPPYSVVAMGFVVVPGLDQDGSLFAGVNRPGFHAAFFLVKGCVSCLRNSLRRFAIEPFG